MGLSLATKPAGAPVLGQLSIRPLSVLARAVSDRWKDYLPCCLSYGVCAPISAIRGTLIEPRESTPKGSLDDLACAGEEPIAIHYAEREAADHSGPPHCPGLRVDWDTRDITLPSARARVQEVLFSAPGRARRVRFPAKREPASLRAIRRQTRFCGATVSPGNYHRPGRAERRRPNRTL